MHREARFHTPRLGLQNNYSIRKEECLLDVMGDQDQGWSLVHPELQEVFLQIVASQGIQRRIGFIEQQNLWLSD